MGLSFSFLTKNIFLPWPDVSQFDQQIRLYVEFFLQHNFPNVVYKLFTNGLHGECRGSYILLR